jgi:hypothetical protein
MAELITEYQKVLKEKREEYNQIFALFRLNYPNLDEESFRESLFYLLITLNFRSKDLPEKELWESFVKISYKKTLEMVAKNILGKNSFIPEFAGHWHAFLQSIGKDIFYLNEFCFSYLPNSIHNLSVVSEFPLKQWMEEYTKLISTKENLSYHLNLGLVLAWKLGMAKYRDASLECLKSFSASLISEIFHYNITDSEKSAFLFFLQENPWRKPSEFRVAKKDYTVTTRKAGSYIGLGGEFRYPPRFYQGLFQFLTDGEDIFQIYADCFGVNIEKFGGDSFPDLPKGNPLPVQKTKDNIQISGKIYDSIPFPKEVTIKSSYHSFTIVSPFSHSILVGGIC